MLSSVFSITAIFVVFALIHSITVSQWLKERCKLAFGETFMRVWYRFLYTLVSGATTAFAIYVILQIPDTVVWQGPLWFRWIMHAIQIGGLLFGSRAFDHLDKWEFLGIRQVLRRLIGKEVSGTIEGLTRTALVTDGVYGIVRHPLYVAGIIVFTFNPNLTVNRITITVLADLYFLFGMFIEEQRFLRYYGDQYREYMKTVPRMIPRWRKRDNEKQGGRRS